MKTIRLEERSDDGTILDILDGQFSKPEWELLLKFTNHLDRVRGCTLFRRGIPGITGMNWKEGRMEISAASYTNAELYELLHVLRPLILHNEPASFGAVRSVLGKCFKNKRLSARLKELQYMFDHGQLASYMQLTVGEQPIFDDSLLRIWLNGTQYHTEEAKAAAWSKLEVSLTTENARAIVINQLRDKVNAILFLSEIVGMIVGDITVLA